MQVGACTLGTYCGDCRTDVLSDYYFLLTTKDQSTGPVHEFSKIVMIFLWKPGH